MQVNDTVRAVHTAGAIRRAFYATVLSVQPTIPGDIGTNGEPTLTLGFLDPALLHMVGGIEFHRAFRRITTVRHVSHDEVQSSAAEYCWTDLLPNDGGIIVIASLNMDDLNEPAAQPSEPEDTIGTIVYINHKNGLEVWHAADGLFIVNSHDEALDALTTTHRFTDLFSAQVFVDHQPAASIEGSPRDLLGHQMYGEKSEEVAKARYEIHKKNEADVAAAAITQSFNQATEAGLAWEKEHQSDVPLLTFKRFNEAGAIVEMKGPTVALMLLHDGVNFVPIGLTKMDASAFSLDPTQFDKASAVLIEGAKAAAEKAAEPSAADLDAVAAEQEAKEATETPGFQKVADDAAALHAEPELVIETKEYTDGTTATGVAPLPDQSPAQQEAAEAPAQQ